jgi:hypothetical protein
MRKITLFIVMVIMSITVFSQSVGYETRTNESEYLKIGFKSFELRHKTNNLENRLTYSKKIWKDRKLTLRLPLHYKFESELMSFEPRLYLNLNGFQLWSQTEFTKDERLNTAFAIDIPYNKYKFRFGWDTSDTFRFGVGLKLL